MARGGSGAVATQLIFLLATVQTIPLPASTLDPQVQSSHNSRTPPVTSWASGNDPMFTNDRPTSVYVEQHRQTAVYEGGPVWSSSPDIEEPFYPTTASSDHLSTENIPVTPKSISGHAVHTETYPPGSVEKTQSEYRSSTEFSSQDYGLHSTHGEELTAKNSTTTTEREEDASQVYSHTEQSVNSLLFSSHKVSPVEEPHALPLQASSNFVVSDNETNLNTQTDIIEVSPKKVDYSVQQNYPVTFKAVKDHEGLTKNSTTFPTTINVSITQSRKFSQRLVIRDLSNVSEPVFSSVVSSHGSNSTNLGNASLRPNVRASKAIGSFPHSSAADSSDARKERVSNDGKVQTDIKVGQNPFDPRENKSISKILGVNNDAMRDNGTGTDTNHSIINPNSSTFQNNSRNHPHENVSEQIDNRRSYIESGSSKLAHTELNNKTISSMSNSSSVKSSISSRDGLPVDTVNSSFQNATPNPLTGSTVGMEQRENSSPESPVPFDIGMSQKITTLSDTDEAGNLTPVHNHEFIGRSASLSHDVETTMEPSIAPVSKSRISASPPDIPTQGLDAASITGIALGIVVFAGLTGAVSFILYRRRYLNKPQTLNDKCSNPDSSGYIDDSTLRENSEEMYSLDNDSFLNSLEAMTIQNYWTDNVKHTKL